MVRALLSLGSNVGNRARNLSAAFAKLRSTGILLTRTSFLYETKPQHVKEQPNFFNAACAIETDMQPLELLRTVKEVEHELGRQMRYRFGPREIDIDIVAYDDLVLRSEELTIPHPRMHERSFVLEPLQDVAPDYRHPLIKKTVTQLAQEVVEGSSAPRAAVRVLPFEASDSIWRWGEKTYVMGILNVTPDSFSDGGSFALVHEACAHAVALHQAGADIVDIGGQSTRPGAQRLSARQELDRVLPVVELLHKKVPDILLSIDTFHPEVAHACVAAGAHMVNDVTGGRMDNGIMLDTVADLKVPYILMHSRGDPSNMQTLTQYDDLHGDISTSLNSGVEAALCAGIDYHNLIVDPGIGFAKTADQNLAMLKDLPPTDLPLLVGASRKGFIARIIGDPAMESRDWGTAATVCASVAAGADVVRVHNVKAMSLVAKVADAIYRTKHDTSGAQSESIEGNDEVAATL